MKQKVKDKLEKRSTELLVLSAIIVVGGAVATASSSNILDAGASSSDGLVAEYRFDTGAGNTAYDTSGGNNDGTINSASWTSGVKGGALKFDGNDDTVNVGNSLPQSAPLTVTGWMYIESSHSNEADMIGNYDGNGWIFRTRPGNSDEIELWFGGSGHSSSANAVTERDRWVYLTATLDESGEINYYKNGKKIDTVTTSDSITSTSNDFRLGSRGDSDTRNDLLGKLDQIKVYSESLNQSQIKSMYNSGSWRIGTVTDEDDPSKVAEFSFQHQNSSQVLDTSGYNNHGERVNGVGQETSVGCKVGRCYSFDGSNEYTEISNPPEISSSSENFTIMFWMKPESTGNSNPVIEYDGGLHIWQYNSEDDFWLNPKGDCNGFEVTGAVELDKWNHYTATYDSANEEFRIYSDGRLLQTDSQNCSPATSSTDLYFGNRDGDNRHFDGRLDQVKVFNSSLSQAEIIEKTQGLESNGAVLDMRFDSGGGDHVEDYSMEDNHGSLNPDEVSGPDRVDGLMGEALKFDGTDDYVSVPDSSSLDIGDGGLTVSAWTYLQEDSNGNNWMLFDKGTSQSGTYYLYSDGNSVRMTVKDGSSRYDASVDPSKIPEDKWIHLVGRYTGSQVELWLDGEKIASNTAPANLGSNSEPVWIGEYQGNDYELEGKMDNARIFSHAISESEIKQLYATGKSHVGSSSGNSNSGLQDSLFLSQTFDRIETCGQSDTVSCPSGVSGKVAVDESGSANHGEINGPTVKSAGDCKLSGCLGFSGGSADMSYSENLNDTLGTLPVTISMWYKPEESVSDWQTVMPWTGSYNGGSGNVRVEVDGQQTALYTRWIGQDGSANWARGGGPGIETGEWQFHTSVITENQIKTFTNGELHSSSSHSFNSLANLDSDMSVSPSFSSSIDQVRVYNQSLSNQEVWKLYTNGRDREKGMGSPIGWWRFDKPDNIGSEHAPAKSCNEIYDIRDTPSSGTYWIDPNQDGDSQQVYCDMGGRNDGWTLIYNYDHEANTNPDPTEGEFPLNHGALSHQDNLQRFGFNQELIRSVRFRCETSNHDRIVSYLSKDSDTIQGVLDDSTTIGYQSVANSSYKFPEHNGSLPDVASSDTGESEPSNALFGPGFPMYQGGEHHWSIGEPNRGGNRWECDDYPGNDNYDTLHQIWVGSEGAQTANDNSETNTGLLGGSDSEGSNDPKFVDGKTGKALNFDGSDDYVSVPDSSELDIGSSDATITFWLKTEESPDNYDNLVMKSSSSSTGNPGYLVNLHPSGSIVANIDDGSSKVEETGDITVNDGSWNFIAVKYDRDENMEIFVNGEKDGEWSISDIGNADTSEPLRIGDNPDWGSDRAIDGKIDDVRIYPYALTSEQVKQVKNGGAVSVG